MFPITNAGRPRKRATATSATGQALSNMANQNALALAYATNPAAQQTSFQDYSQQLNTTGKYVPAEPLTNPLDELTQKIGEYADLGLSETHGRQTSAEDLLRQYTTDLANDPTLALVRQMALQSAQNPGVSQETIDALKGKSAARSAANQAASERKLLAQLARGNISGSSAAALLAANRNRNAVERESGAKDVETWAAEQERTQQTQALQSLMSILQGQWGMYGNANQALAQTLTNYNPLQLLQQAQNLTAPVTDAAYAQTVANSAPRTKALMSQLRKVMRGE